MEECGETRVRMQCHGSLGEKRPLRRVLFSSSSVPLTSSVAGSTFCCGAQIEAAAQLKKKNNTDKEREEITGDQDSPET